MPTPTAAALVLAGGTGSRVGAAGNKVYLPLAGRPMLAWSLGRFVTAPGIGVVVMVVRDGEQDQAERLVAELTGDTPVEVVTGGDTRQGSELGGLRHLAPRIEDGTIDVVLVHDGARPLVRTDLITAVLREARAAGGAVPGVPCDGLVRATEPDRLDGAATDGLVAVQTPQGFRAGPLLQAYLLAERAGFAGTDTASCVQRFAPGLTVRVIPGDPRNFKITYPHDVAVAEHVLS